MIQTLEEYEKWYKLKEKHEAFIERSNKLLLNTEEDKERKHLLLVIKTAKRLATNKATMKERILYVLKNVEVYSDIEVISYQVIGNYKDLLIETEKRYDKFAYDSNIDN